MSAATADEIADLATLLADLGHAAEGERLRAFVAAAERENSRFEWMLKNCHCSTFGPGHTGMQISHGGHIYHGENLRAAIDAVQKGAA